MGDEMELQLPCTLLVVLTKNDGNSYCLVTHPRE